MLACHRDKIKRLMWNSYVMVKNYLPECCSHAFWETNSLRKTMQIIECRLLHQQAQGRVSS